MQNNAKNASFRRVKHQPRSRFDAWKGEYDNVNRVFRRTGKMAAILENEDVCNRWFAEKPARRVMPLPKPTFEVFYVKRREVVTP